MKILLTGGGTGGHITPLLAVAHELKKQDPGCQIIYVGERNGKFSHIIDGNSNFDEFYAIRAGKFRRYHGQSWLGRLFDVKTNLLNLRDFFYFIVGYFQSRRLLSRVKPDVILLKGGFVGVPVGLAAARKKIPFITHDSDALPGLANRLVAKWAHKHAVALPVENYSYKPEETVQVGVLVSEDYKAVDNNLLRNYRSELNLRVDARILVVTGGSLGARRLNQIIVKLVPSLLETYEDLIIIHQVGKGNQSAYGDFTHNRLQVTEFFQGMYRYTGAADIVVTRAGANTLAELGVQGKACIIVPNPMLTGGHQTKNSDLLEKMNAALVVREGDQIETELKSAIIALLDKSDTRTTLAKNLQSVTIPDAANKLATLLLNTKGP